MLVTMKVSVLDLNMMLMEIVKKEKKDDRRRSDSNRGPLDPKSAMLAPTPRRLKVFMEKIYRTREI